MSNELIPNPTNKPLKNVEVSPKQPIPTPAPVEGAGPTRSGGRDTTDAPQGSHAVDMPAGLVAAADKSAVEDARREQKEDADAAREPEGFKSRVWGPILSPIVSLAAICIVVSLLLGLTNNVTAPLIETNATAAADAARMSLMPEADGFTELDVTVEAPNVTALYEASNGVGYIVEAYGKGYGGNVPAMIAFDADGNIQGVTFLSNNETPGLGSKLISDEGFYGQFAGLPAEALSLSDVDAIASATISTNAGLTAINAAINLYREQILGLDADAGGRPTEKADPAATEGADQPAQALPAPDPADASIDYLEEAE